MKKVSKVAVKKFYKEQNLSRFQKSVLRIALSQAEEYTGDDFLEQLQSFFKDMQHGCVSGIISKFIYTRDCCKYFNYNKKDIMKLVSNYIYYDSVVSESGYVEFGDMMLKVDTSKGCEVLTRYFDDNDKVTLVWYAIEETMFRLGDMIECQF